MTGNHKTFWIPGDYDSQEYAYNETNLSEIDNSKLDAYHGHTSATADYPNGIYHYHITSNDPYINGSGYYGTPGTISQ